MFSISSLHSGKAAKDGLTNEAGAGIEPANRGFADPDLTTWLPRRTFREPEGKSASSLCQRSHRQSNGMPEY
jgi:hypothetical protein